MLRERSLLVAVPLVLVLAACAGRAAARPPTDEERELLSVITTDRRVVIERTFRDEADRLVVWTRQGGVDVAYRLEAAADGKLTIVALPRHPELTGVSVRAPGQGGEGGQIGL